MSDSRVEGPVAEHGERDADALAGEAEEGLGVGRLPWPIFPVDAGAAMAANTERKRARLICLFPLPEGCSPQIDEPELRVVGGVRYRR